MPRTSTWDARRLPRQDGKTFAVTGGTSGIGYFIAEQIAATGAHVILAARSDDKASLAIRAVRAREPQASLSTVRLDLGDLGSVRSAADQLNAAERLDGIVLNAGVLASGGHGSTADGHESMYGTNHLGHFALGALIYQALARHDGSRIVTMGSVAARSASLNLDDLESSHGSYRAFDVYKRSKLAQMIFAFELDRRARQAGSRVSSLVAHPGGALDGLTPPAAGLRPQRVRHGPGAPAGGGGAGQGPCSLDRRPRPARPGRRRRPALGPTAPAFERRSCA